MADKDFEVTISIDLETTNATQATQQFLQQFRQGTTGLDGEITKIEKGLGRASRSQQNYNAQLSTTRYALYDVSSTLTRTGAVLLGLSVASTAVAVAWERDFAQVVRTTGVTGDAVDKLQKDLVGLAQTMPVAFGDIAEIATLAGQLGVAEGNVASFTQTVAKFSAVTDLSVDAAATAFGRLDALLPDVKGNYEALGSSIAKVGINSVATESQIVAISTQVSSMGTFAGLTAAEVVGLSGALASIGAAPEISRGTVTRVFIQMQKAISQGGDALDRFAQISGTTSQEFASAFGTQRFGPIFQSFIENLNDTSKTGGDATAALRDLGITSVRDVPLLLRLAGAGDVLATSLKDARTGFEEGTELNKQYGIISETTAARLQILVNNFNAFLAAIGSANLGPLGDLVDGLSGFLSMLTDIASTDIGGTILGWVSILGALAGVLGIAAGAMALFGASSIGVQQALIGLAGTKAGAVLMGAGTSAAVASGQMNAAAASARLLGVALKALSLIGLVIAIPDLSKGFQDMLNGITGASTEIDDRITELGKSVDGFGYTLGATNDVGANFAKGLSDFGLPMTEFNRKVKEIDDGLAEMAENNAPAAAKRIRELREMLGEAGIGASQFNILFADSIKATQSVADAAEEVVDPMQQMADAEAEAAESAERFAASLGLTADAVEGMKGNLTTGSQAFFDMAKAIEDATTDGTFSLQKFIENMEAQVAAQAGFTNNLGQLAARGATNFAAELAKGGPGAAQAAAALVGASDVELARLEELARVRAANSATGAAEAFVANIPILQAAYKSGGDAAVISMQQALSKGGAAVAAELEKMKAVAMAKPIPIHADPRPALDQVNALQREINSRTATMHVYTVMADGSYTAIRDPKTYRYADGGAINGPGTGTSDDIPIWASNGEYMIKAAARRKYGTGFLDAINSGRMPKFASGGPIGGSTANTGSGINGIIELGPQTMRGMGGGSTTVVVRLDDEAISRAAERGNKKRRSNGS